MKIAGRMTAVIFIFLFMLAIGTYALPVIFQEGNPFPVFAAIIKVELSSSDIAPVSATKYLQKRGSTEHFKRLMASKGWYLVEQLGAGHFFAQNGETLFVESRMFTGRYVVYELEKPL